MTSPVPDRLDLPSADTAGHRDSGLDDHRATEAGNSKGCPAFGFCSYAFAGVMDARLSYYLGRRLTRLRKSDLPPVALAIVGHVEGFCEAQRLTVHETPIIRIWGSGVDVVVCGEDWERIVPFLRDGTFNPISVPLPQSVPLHPILDLSSLDARQQAFYSRVLGVLQTLFPEDYPTSDL